jgi:hypothetical protein
MMLAPPLQDQQQQQQRQGMLCQQPLQRLQSMPVRCRRSRQHSMVCSTSSRSVASSGASSLSWILSSFLQTTPSRGRSCSTGRLHTCWCSPQGLLGHTLVHCSTGELYQLFQILAWSAPLPAYLAPCESATLSGCVARTALSCQ